MNQWCIVVMLKLPSTMRIVNQMC